MKKLLLAASTILAGTIATTFSSHSLTAEAKVHSLNNTIAKNIKKGTFPHANGKIGTVRKNLKLKKQGNTFYSRSIPKNFGIAVIPNFIWNRLSEGLLSMPSTRENVLNRTLFSQRKAQKNSASCGRKSFPQLAHFS